MTTGATRCCPEQEGTSPEALTPSVLQFSDTKTEVPPGSALQGDSGSLTGPGTPPGQWKDTDTGEAPSSAARKNTGTESRAAQKSPHPCPRSAKQCCAETRSCPRNQMGTFCGESCADFYHHAPSLRGQSWGCRQRAAGFLQCWGSGIRPCPMATHTLGPWPLTPRRRHPQDIHLLPGPRWKHRWPPHHRHQVGRVLGPGRQQSGNCGVRRHLE